MEGLGNRVRMGNFKFLHRDPIWFESVRIVHAFVEKHIDKALEIKKKREAGNGVADNE